MYPSTAVTAKETIEDYSLESYQIPKNSTIIIDIASIQQSSKIYENPSIWNPERFLNDFDPQTNTTYCYFPFSLGKHNCIGILNIK